jgi:putative cardiolipin synthase
MESCMSSRIVRLATLALAIALSAACASAPKPLPDPPPSYVKAPGPKAAFSSMEADLERRHGKGVSGFKLLRTNGVALRSRLAAVDAARESIDLQYYLWYGDDAGRLLLSHVLDAAERGVFIRILVDDLMMIDRDLGLSGLDAHRNIELRVFNPWDGEYRHLLGRAVQFIAGMSKLNHRMHNKLLIVDSQLAIIGGRNIGTEYFGLNEKFNFHDLDLLTVGPAAREVEGIFDHFFNSNWVIPALELTDPPSDEEFTKMVGKVDRLLSESKNLGEFALHAVDRTDMLNALREELVPGRARAIYDLLPEEGDHPGREGSLQTADILRAAKREVQITNAYVIPKENPDGIFAHWQKNGVRVKLLTNSLSSHDVPAVNGAYKKKRGFILDYGVDLYELRADAAVKSFQDTPPVVSKFLGLHTKSYVIDRERIFVGSLNFDGRSITLTTEMGLLVESPELARQLGEYMDTDMSGENAWHVQRDEKGKMYWENSDERVTRQPARGFSQRMQDFFFGLLPIEDQL